MTGSRRSAPAAALGELEGLYAALDEELAGLGFGCRMDGACCRFGESGLSLFATFLEACYLLHESSGTDDRGVEKARDSRGACPFLEGDACSRRARRTLGCRIYCCDPASGERRSEIYEKFHLEIQRLHERYDLPYEYRDLREWVREPPLC